MEIKKKAVYFTIDAIVALTVVMALIIFAVPFVNYQNPTNKIHYDALSTLSNLKVGDFNNAQVKAWIANGTINDTGKSLLEQLGEFYFTDPAKAKILADAVFSTIPTNKNIGIWFVENGDEANAQLITSRNVTSYETAKNVDVSRQTITSIREGENVTGYSARAYLSNVNQVKYYYFGGYVGDGNITIYLNYTGTIQKVSVELTTNTNFLMKINGNLVGQYSNSSSEYSPIKYNVPSSDLSFFQQGTNQISLLGNTNDKLRISGGFIRITYNSSDVYSQETRKNLPGVRGIINIYDGFYVPNTLNSLSVYLHFNSSEALNFTIGNKSVYNFSGGQEQRVTLGDSILSNLLNYSALSNKTIPYRVYNLGANATAWGNADVVLITDVSGSMDDQLTSNLGNSNSTRKCGSPDMYLPDTQRLSFAKCLDYDFARTILSVPGDNLSLVSFSTSADNYLGLTKNLAQINNTIKNYNATGDTCIACAINRAYQILNSSNPANRSRFIIVMTDGITNVRAVPNPGGHNSCSKSTEYRGNQTTGWDCITTDPDADCSASLLTNIPGRNANYSSCRVYKEQKATVYSIGFGAIAGGCPFAIATLQAIANCGNGTFYASNDPVRLQEVYNEIAQTILNISYQEQVSNSTGITTELYPDSYIQFGFNAQPTPPGIVLTSEKQFTNSTSGSFIIPANSTLLSAAVTSYSGPKWTSLVTANGFTAYNLSIYGKDFSILGDPYSINIPVSALSNSSENQISLLTGTVPGTFFNGSVNNSIIYTILKDLPAFNVSFNVSRQRFTSATGCKWNITFQDDSTMLIKIPAGYSGNNSCSYSPLNSNKCSFSQNDAIESSTCNVLKLLDFQPDGKIDDFLSEGNLVIDTSSITGIPFKQQIEVQIRTWS